VYKKYFLKEEKILDYVKYIKMWFNVLQYNQNEIVYEKILEEELNLKN